MEFAAAPQHEILRKRKLEGFYHLTAIKAVVKRLC